MAKIVYVCKTHPDVVLFEEEVISKPVDLNEMILDRPAYCEPCNKHYYKHECTPKK